MKNQSTRRRFLKNMTISAAGMSVAPGVLQGAVMDSFFRKQKPKVAFLANIYRNSAHADVIGTKLFIGIPTDDGIRQPEVEVVSMWIDQIGDNDTGLRIAEMNRSEERREGRGGGERR